MMMPCSRLPSLHAHQSCQSVMEDLHKLLQDTGSSVDWILSRYTALNAKFSEPEVSDVRTSLSMGTTPKICNNGQETQIDNDDVAVSSLVPTKLQASAAGKSGRFCNTQNWHSQKQPAFAVQEKSSLGMDTLASNHKDHLLGEDAFRVLLEEIKKTIHTWLSRQKALFHDRSSRSIAHEGVLVSSGLCMPNGALLSGSEKEHSPATRMRTLGGATSGENRAELQNEEENRGVTLQHHNQKEENKRCGLILQQDRETGHFISDTGMERSGLDKVMDGIASPRQHHEQPMAGHPQDLSKRDQSAYLSPERSNTQADTSSTEAGIAANTNSNFLLKENEPAAEAFSTPMNKEPTESTLPLTKWAPPATPTKTGDKTLIFPRTVEVIASPDWLPEGWITELKTRGSGNSAGSKDKYYVDPVTHRRFRSRKEVIAYLERGKPKSSESPETSPVKKFVSPELLPSISSKSSKRAKRKETAVPTSSVFPAPLAPSAASSGPLGGNMFMPPFRTGQPSEWLVYESLASLPFPMFDPFYYTDFGANKSNIGKGPHMPTRPWFFSGPETSWSPFMDRSSFDKSGDKGRDYQNYFSMPPYPSEVASKQTAGSVKKSSKRKSAD